MAPAQAVHNEVGVYEYAPKRVKRFLKATNDSWRVDETYIKIKGKWFYLYRAVDSEGNICTLRIDSGVYGQAFMWKVYDSCVCVI